MSNLPPPILLAGFVLPLPIFTGHAQLAKASCCWNANIWWMTSGQVVVSSTKILMSRTFSISSARHYPIITTSSTLRFCTLRRSRLSPGKATRISHGRSQRDNTVVTISRFHLFATGQKLCRQALRDEIEEDKLTLCARLASKWSSLMTRWPTLQASSWGRNRRRQEGKNDSDAW